MARDTYHFGQFEVRVTTSKVGPLYDPYLRSVLAVTRKGTDHSAEYEVCGLNGTTVRLFNLRTREVVRHFHVREPAGYFFDVKKREKTIQRARLQHLKARLLFKQYIGVDPDVAQGWVNEFEQGRV